MSRASNGGRKPPVDREPVCLACWLEARGEFTGKAHNGLGPNCPADWPDELPAGLVMEGNR